MAEERIQTSIVGAHSAVETGQLDVALRLLEPILDRADVVVAMSEDVLAHCVAVAALVRAAQGAEDAAEYCTKLLQITATYRRESAAHLGSHLPRYERAVRLAQRALLEADPEYLIESADHLSQTWPGFAESIFPELYAMAASALGGSSPLAFGSCTNP